VRSQHGRCIRHTGEGYEVAFGFLHLGLVQGNHSTAVDAVQLGQMAHGRQLPFALTSGVWVSQSTRLAHEGI
jgi:hypothetical protein